MSRIASRFGVEYVNAINTLVLLLPGASITYQGDELGMKDIELSYEDTKDVVGRRAGPVSITSPSDCLLWLRTSQQVCVLDCKFI